jgi:hypothetical protein
MILLLHVGLVVFYLAVGIQYAIQDNEPTSPTTIEETIKESPASN